MVRATEGTIITGMLLWMVKIAALGYLGMGLMLYLTQRSIMYYRVAENPAEDVVAEYHEADGVRLKVWVVSPGKDKALLYFGGNAEDVYGNAEEFARALPDHTVYLINYRGYGGSDGTPSEQGLFSDALAIFDRLQTRHPRIAVLGRSLGSGVAVYLASRRDVSHLVLATPHDSVLAVARRAYPIFPVDLLLKDRYESIRYAPDVEAKTLLLAAEDDRIIPIEHAARLADAFEPGLAELVVVAGSGHNTISALRSYWQAVSTFVGTPD